MQISYDPRHWNEDAGLERERARIASSTAPADVRRLFPLSVRILKEDRTYGLTKGQILLYARTKLKPSLYPIEAVSYGIRQRLPRETTVMQYSSAEVEVITPEEALTALQSAAAAAIDAL